MLADQRIHSVLVLLLAALAACEREDEDATVIAVTQTESVRCAEVRRIAVIRVSVRLSLVAWEEDELPSLRIESAPEELEDLSFSPTEPMAILQVDDATPTTTDDETGGEYWLWNVWARAARPFSGVVRVAIVGTGGTSEGAWNETITLRLQFDGDASACPSDDPPDPPASGCPLGDLVFAWSSNGGGIQGDLGTFAGIAGGEVCRAAPWSTTGSQAWPAVSGGTPKLAYFSLYDEVDPATGDIETIPALFVVPFDGTADPEHQQDPANAVRTGASWQHLAWSPDGEWLAATESGGSSPGAAQRIVAIRVADGDRFEVAAGLPTAYQMHPSWSPGGGPQSDGFVGKIYFAAASDAGLEPSLHSIDVDLTGATPVFSEHAVVVDLEGPGAAALQALGVFGFYAPDCSPDGSKIAFIASRDTGRVSLYEIDQEAFRTGVSTAGAERDNGDDNPTWWDDETVVFQREIEDPEIGFLSVFFSVRVGDGEQEEIRDENGERLPGSTTMPAVVPEAAR